MINYIKSSIPYYKRMITIAFPIMIQNGVTNFVNMLDNIMVGQVGTLQMTSVSIVNQLIFVFNLCIFGALSGAGIFTAQFYGKKDDEGVKNTLQFKIVSAIILTLAGLAVFILFGDNLISAYIQSDSDPQDIALVASYSKSYLNIMLWGNLPFAIASAYASTMRETNDRVIPMISTVTAVFINLILNYILIFGHFGAPEMGIEGAAIATVIARFAECGILMVWGHTHKKKYPFLKRVVSKTTLTKEQIKKIIIVSTPLLINEGLWSMGMAFLNQCYSVRGLSVVAAINIVNTLNNVFNVAFIAFGSAIGIILSQMLGAGKKDEAAKSGPRMIFFATSVVLGFAVVMMCFSRLFPGIYNTEQEVKDLASTIIIVIASFMPVQAFTNACYFTLRSGGKTFITFLFDSGFVWMVSVPLAFCLSRFTEVPIVPLYITVLSADIIKCILGYTFVHKGVWLNTVVDD